VLDRLSEAAQAITQEPDFQREWGDRDVVVQWRGAAAFSQAIRPDMKTWSDLVHTRGIKPQ